MHRMISIVLLALCWVPCSARLATAQRLHALVVSDQSEWAGWGAFLPNVQMDAFFMYVQLRNNVPENRLDLIPVAIEDEPGSPQTLLDQLSRIRPRPEDTLLFYYSGHGGSDDRGHFLALEQGKLYRSELRQRMQAGGVRLVVIITDCCNVRADGQAFGAPAPFIEPPTDVSPLFQSLFFARRGVVDINSCSPGESAYFFVKKRDGMYQGSLFTGSLTSYFEAARNRSVSWDRLLRDVSLRVLLEFESNYPRGAAAGKGRPRQMGQTVEAIAYPGMPERRGPRTGLVVRDYPGQGAMIIRVRSGYPGAQVYDLRARRYVALQPNQVILAANGRRVLRVQDFVRIVRDAPQIMRLQVAGRRGTSREYLMRLRY